MSMNPLLQQFIQEARDFLQGISEQLMALEAQPDDADLMTELFRLVHTLKGNSGLFDLPAMTRVLHAAEDLMDAVRDGRVPYSQLLADALLDAMDLIAVQLDEVEATGTLDPSHLEAAEQHVASLRALIPASAEAAAPDAASGAAAAPVCRPPAPPLSVLTEAERMAVWQAAAPEVPLYRVLYYPDPECFFAGEDPLYQARHTPGIAWGQARALAPWPPLAELDCYRCALVFDMLVRAPRSEILEHYRYVPDQIELSELPLIALALPAGHPNGGPVYGDFVAEALQCLEDGDLDGLRAATEALLEISSPELWLSSALRWLKLVLDTAPQQKRALRRLIESLNTLSAPDWQPEDWLDGASAAMPAAPSTAEPPQVETKVEAEEDAPDEQAAGELAMSLPPLEAEEESLRAAMLAVQEQILALPDEGDWLPGRLQACAASVRALISHTDQQTEGLDAALAEAVAERRAAPLAQWLRRHLEGVAVPGAVAPAPTLTTPVVAAASPPAAVSARSSIADHPAAHSAPAAGSAAEPKFGRRAEDAPTARVLKVDQAKVDRLMNLIGEIVVAKNSLPYLANRAENLYGVRDLAREIKSQYAVINRIAEEMQDAIMQVRMLPVSFVFQRFPRLVRDLARKLGKEVELVLEGEETEADKNIVEALADPLIHIVRNSLDHGLETPEARLAAGKPPTGRLVIRAQQESDRVLIEVSDDGKGIDPAVIKRKAYEKGLIDEAQLERISDQEAINLVFAPGFSTAEQVSDLSGRGVGMDVVRNAIDKVGGSVSLTSVVGRGTRLRLSLPLSMAVSNVMVVESDRQIFGVPMERVVETVRLPQGAVRTIKHQQTAVLRGKIVPLRALNALLGIAAEPKPNADGELAVLVVRVGEEPVGLIVDAFREVVDVILKPLPGGLAKLSCYAGTALLGDGSVLMVLNPKELF